MEGEVSFGEMETELGFGFPVEVGLVFSIFLLIQDRVKVKYLKLTEDSVKAQSAYIVITL